MRGSLILALALLGTACDDEPGANAGADGGAAGGCVTADLIAQCPAGANPVVGAQAVSSCAGAAGGVILDADGQAAGQCYGAGACRVACQFAVPCRCGVQSITRDGVICASCEGAASCGNGLCEGGEDPQSCPIDCGAVCEPGERRCAGEGLEECSLQGGWEALACPRGELCAHESGRAACVPDPDIIVGGDAGVGDGGVPIDEARVIPGPASWPETSDESLERQSPRFGHDLRIEAPLQDGSINNRPTPFANAMRNLGGTIQRWILVPGELTRIEGLGTSGRLRLDADGALVNTVPPAHPPVELDAFCAIWLECMPQADRPRCEQIWQAAIDGGGGPEHLGCLAALMPDDCVFAQTRCTPNPVHLYPGLAPDLLGTANVFARQGRRLLTMNAAQTAGVVFDLGEGAAYAHDPLGDFRFSGDRRRVALSADGRVAVWVAQAAEQQLVVVWDVQTGQRRPILPQGGGQFVRVALSPDGQVLAAVMRGTGDPTTDEVVSFWSLAEEARILSLRPPPDAAAALFGERGLAFSPDGHTVAIQIREGAEIWDLEDGPHKRHTLEGNGRQVQSLTWAPDGRTLALAMDEVSLWRDGGRLQTLENSRGATLHDVAFADDGQRLLVVRQDAGLSLWFSVFSASPP